MRKERTPKDMMTLVHRSTDTTVVPALQQAMPTRNDESECATTVRLDSSVREERDTRWSEICQRIKVDHNLDEGRQQQLWGVLERYQDVFAWNKGELGCYTVGEHVIDTQGFPPCRAALGRLSYWEEAEVKR